jgi:hypothetical protein
MSDSLQPLRSLLPDFRLFDCHAYNSFAAVARLPRGSRFDSTFMRQFYHLADKMLRACPHELKGRRLPRDSPPGEQKESHGCYCMFRAPTGEDWRVEEWLLLKPMASATHFTA